MFSDIKKKNKLTKVAFLLNGILFLMGGILLIKENKPVFGIIQLLASILNILMILKIRKEKTIQQLNYTILSMNIIVCLSIAVDSIQSNKSYIQFVWFIAAIVSLVTLILQIKRKKISPNNSDK